MIGELITIALPPNIPANISNVLGWLKAASHVTTHKVVTGKKL